MQLPYDFKIKYKKLLGNDYSKFIDSFNQPIYTGFRINPLKENQPTEENLNHPIKYTKLGYYGKVNGKTIDHQSGAVYSQEPSAMYVGEVANPNPGERVLDLCAAPGGKTTHLASFMNNQGLIVTNDIIPKRAKVLAENVERFGIQNALVLNEDPKSLVKPFKKYFDKILVDAPCSGEGMFRKNPNAINYWNADYPKKCSIRQREILNQAIKMLKPGGQLIYSTCTFAPEEDEQIIDWLMNNYELKVLPIKKYQGMIDGRPDWGNGSKYLKNTARLFPYLIKGEGHFIAKLQKDGTNKNPKIKKYQQNNLSNNQKQLWDQFNQKYLNNFKPSNLITFGQQLYAINYKVPSLKGLKVISPGIHLGTFKKKRFEPSYALGLALNSNQVVNHINITEEQWENYVHGDTINVDKKLPKGWYQLICKKQSISFGKVVNGVVKNFFPKGLRFKI